MLRQMKATTECGGKELTQRLSHNYFPYTLARAEFDTPSVSVEKLRKDIVEQCFEKVLHKTDEPDDEVVTFEAESGSMESSRSKFAGVRICIKRIPLKKH